VAGRLKDVIIRGGENLLPALIEGALARHLSGQHGRFQSDQARLS